VIRGPGGTIWGPNAVNGVINIITRNTKDTRGTFVSAGGGNEEQGFLNARYGGGNGDGFDYRVYETAFTRSPENHSDGKNFDDWRSIQGGFRMDWKNARNGDFTLQGDIYEEAAGESEQNTNYTAPYSQIVNSNALLSGGNVMGRWQKTINDHDDIQLQVYYDRTNRQESNIADLRNTFDVDFLQRLKLPARQKVTWGLGGRVVPITDTPVVSGLTFVPANRTDYLVTGFFQDEIALVDRKLTLTVGTKLVQTNFLHGIGWEPSGRLAWTPSDKQTVWAAFTHALRTPSDVEENFYLSGYVETLPNGTPYFARFNANSRFSPEQMNGYELGYRRLLNQHFLIDTSTYFNHYHDLFDEEFAGATFFETSEPGVTTPAPAHYLLPALFGNGLLAYTKGIEVSPEWRPTTYWRLRGSYSYLHMDVYKAPNSGDIGTAAGIQGSSPVHQVTVTSALDVSKKIQLDLTFRYVSALPGQLVPAYSTGDARLAWQLSPQLELSFVGRNLLQASHFEDAGDPGPLVGIKRSGYAQMTWRR
jgi:iron complex outermembrane receptor protein